MGQNLKSGWMFGIALLAGLLVGAVSSRAKQGADPPCFGAASRDPYHRCSDPRLALAVTPTPAEAQITPGSPCTPADGNINLCSFGVPAPDAVGTIALVGDSHAWQWRAAVDVVARAQRWFGLDSTRSSCPFTKGTPIMAEPKLAGCLAWNRAVLGWFRTRPEISIVFTSDHPGPVKAAPGQSRLAAQVAGITAAWAALPASVKHIVVIRDTPYMHPDTLTCVEAAIRRHQDAGAVCSVARSVALRRDPDVVAAERLHSPRVEVVDLTHFFCSATLCYPVVGGALVYRDEDHLTRVFAATLGPYLLHALGALMASWG